MPGIDESRQFVPLRIAVLTVSDTRDLTDDKSGAILVERIEKAGHAIADRAIVSDDIEKIRARVKQWIANSRVDVIIMGHILHDWDLAQKRDLVKKAYDALPSGGAFVVCEAIIDDERKQNAFGLLMSLNMLIETGGGFDFTGADCSKWMREAGFRETRVEHLIGPDSMVIGIK